MITLKTIAPGLLTAAAAALLAWLAHLALPAVPLLTAAVALGIVVGQVPALRQALGRRLAPGLGFAARSLLRAGIVLLGLKLSLVDIAGLGWVTIATTVAVVVLTFVGTIGLGRALGLPGHQPVLVASGFSICGASAIGAMGAAVRARHEEQAVPVALVTLCGTLAIAVLPALWHPLGLSATQFGHWVGAGVHDVGQVVATAQIAGTAALAVAVVVKLTRVLMLAPMVAITAAVERRRAADVAGPRPAIVPLFVVGFLVAVLVNTFVPLPDWVLTGADVVQTALLAMALFALGASIRVAALVRTGWRALVVGLTSWVLVAVLAYGAVLLG
ncbi:YeiH family protein [Agromyces neolithicus]|uniref:Sulfate exporter family transporter n=1 Tax=Agromyces neolithicus TaxID=269420 RepID=A0ABN2MD54_9MICO